MTTPIRPPLPPTPEPYRLPFFYGSLTTVGVHHLVDPTRLRPFLAGTGLHVAQLRPDDDHNGQMGCVSYNFQLSFGRYGAGFGVSQELEVNILVYPEGAAGFVPEVTFREYLMGQEQTKLYGNHRVHVARDNDFAIEAGKNLFGEPTFKASFATTIPFLTTAEETAWDIACLDPAGAPLFSFRVDLAGLSPVPASFAPIPEYGTRDGRMVVAPWNILQPFQTYFLGADDTARVTLTLSEDRPGQPPVAGDLRQLIGDAPAAAVYVVQSPPVAIQNPPFLVGPYEQLADAEATLATLAVDSF